MGQRQGWTLEELARILGGDVRGPSGLVVRRPVPAGSDDPEGVTFADSPKYLSKVLASGVGAVLVGRQAEPFDKPAVLVDDPRLAFFKLLAIAERVVEGPQGVHELALVDPSVKVPESAGVGPYVVIGPDVVIGERTQIFPFCYIGPGCRIGADCRLLPGVVLVQDVELGQGSVVHSGCVLGSDGFGFVWDGEKHVRVPQTGSVVIGRNVRLGANTTVDRATSGATLVGDGVKVDNNVQIGHNSMIGDHSVLAALTGVGGSVTLGKRAFVGGQTGFADHVTVVDDVKLAGRSGVMGNIDEAGTYIGRPAVPSTQGLKSLALQQRLPELFARLRALEEEVERLKGGD